MEEENGDHQSRKRMRDDYQPDEEIKKELLSSHKGKKPEVIASSILHDHDHDDESCSYRDKTGHELWDPVGVFDFPWLKEGVIFKADEFLENNDDMFAPMCSYVDQVQDTFLANLDESCVQNSLVPPAPDRMNSRDDKFDDSGGDSLWSFQVDDFEPLDRVWSSVVDQPLDNTCLNKA